MDELLIIETEGGVLYSPALDFDPEDLAERLQGREGRVFIRGEQLKVREPFSASSLRIAKALAKLADQRIRPKAA